LISEIGIEPFITPETENEFGSYNILKEEFISLEKAELSEDLNFVEVAQQMIEDETIDYRVLTYSFRVDGIPYILEIGKSLSSINNTYKNVRKVILVFFFIFIVITLLSDLIYTRRILSPLKSIIKKLKATSTPSLFDRTPVRTSTYDFIQLDKTVSDLMSKIEELFEKEKEVTVNISHELMTPLSVLRSKLENMLLKKDLDSEVEAGIEESLRTLHRLKTLVNSLLLIARLEDRQYLKEDDINIGELVNEVTEELNPVAVDAGVAIQLTCSDNLIFIGANRSLIFSMLYNVVNNAVKNTPRDGRIEITVTEHEKKFEVTVSDTGNGMTQKQIDNLFSRFTNKVDPDDKGTGIGLAITKSIADFHSITISVISKPGEGSRFSFLFP
ncbi:MAG: HAMP domain-containing histidine kinase, partial [Candidatus Atribacteria bacterium]